MEKSLFNVVDSFLIVRAALWFSVRKNVRKKISSQKKEGQKENKQERVTPKWSDISGQVFASI